MKVIKINPKGYCHGVVTAINRTAAAISDPTTPRPIYILGMLIHNTHILDEFAKLGAITIDGKDKTRLELLEEVDEGTIIFTAHGVSEVVRENAIAKGLNIIDATCTEVVQTDDIIKNALSEGKKVLFIGQKRHPETEGLISDKENVFLVETKDDVETLSLNQDDEIIITNQTTLSILDVAELIKLIQIKYPKANFINEICSATRTRQEAVIEATKNADLIVVVGDQKSNNSNKLAELAKTKDTDSILISDFKGLIDLDLSKYNNIGVTSGASTPSQITRQVIDYLSNVKTKEELLAANLKLLPGKKIK